MRPTLVASFLLTPVLFASTAFAGSAKAVPATTDASSTPRISTGISGAELLNPTSITIPFTPLFAAGEARFVLALRVDENGMAHDVRMVRSADPEMNARIVDQVSRAHFKPAKLNQLAIATNFELTIDVQR